MSALQEASLKHTAKPCLSLINIDVLSALISQSVVQEASPASAASTTTLVPELPSDTSLVHPPNSLKKTTPQARKTHTHKPSPQVNIYTGGKGKNRTTNASQPLADTSDSSMESLPHVTTATSADQEGSGARGKRGGAVTGCNAQGLSPPPSGSCPGVCTYHVAHSQEHLATSLDEIANTFSAFVTLMKDYRLSAPTTACFAVLDRIEERLVNHHEFPREFETAKSFGAILTKSVLSPIASLSSQLQAQHKAIQSLSKVVEHIKSSPLASQSYAAAAMTASGPPLRSVPKLKASPLPSPSDEHILVRCNGEVVPLLQLPYHQLIPEVNSALLPLSLPRIVYASHLNSSSIFLVPESKDAATTFIQNWDLWGPIIFPGARITPPAVHCHLQIDGIPFAVAGNLDKLAREFEARNPHLGPSWEMVDIAVAGGRVILAGSAPMAVSSRFASVHGVAMQLTDLYANPSLTALTVAVSTARTATLVLPAKGLPRVFTYVAIGGLAMFGWTFGPIRV
ncbi:hypothetical protein C8R44DRAFT_727077 [Mycena epipterygia]|nr:hypothetical protein C8R44DRAFT_727077 [Mycena epipterygia]